LIAEGEEKQNNGLPMPVLPPGMKELYVSSGDTPLDIDMEASALPMDTELIHSLFTGLDDSEDDAAEVIRLGDSDGDEQDGDINSLFG
jgi:hypothetical protein